MPTITPLAYIEPLNVLKAWQNCSYLAFLDSALPHPERGRWSYLAVDPIGVFQVIDNKAYWNNAPLNMPPLEALRHQLQLHGFPHARKRSNPQDPPFQGGAIGTIGYDSAHLFEKIPDAELKSEAPLTQINIGFYERLFAWDVIDKRMFWIAPEGVAPPAIHQPDSDFQTTLEPLIWHAQTPRDVFENNVRNAIDMIRNGDLFQVNLAHRFIAHSPTPPDPYAVYETLRSNNPAPFSALLTTPEGFIASSSPERFLKVVNGYIETRPIKGTRRRHRDPVQDQAAIDELASSDKDRAENVMIVDLLRNDLSKVCTPLSIEVPALCAVESYAHVHHLVSVVTGQLKQDYDALDLIAATFPGGSITGAPKIKAMEAIARLEKTRRGTYCGAIGYIGFDGTLDLNIAIRTLVCEKQTLSLHAGGGITLLSDPASEYDETLAKAEKILSCLGVLDNHS